MSTAITVRPVRPQDLPEIAALHARVFGPGRFARTAYRVREGRSATSRYCLVAVRGARLIAAVQFTPVRIGTTASALLLGPLAVDPEYAGQGHGRRLIAAGLDAARKDGVRLVMLVGDEPYYGRFGFRPVPPGQIRLPGPVDPARLLAAELEPGALNAFTGLVVAE